MDYEEIPFGAFDSELVHQEIYIPEGFEATIKGNKIVLKKTESEDEKIKNQILDCFRTMKQQGCFPSKHEEQYNSWINWLEKQGEQSKEVTYTHEVETGNGNIKVLVTEKVQLPKYKVGDWIVSKYGDLFQIKEVVAGGYKLLCPSGNEEINSTRNVDKSSYLWSIAMARPGDILATSLSIFIFKGFYIANKPKAYCGIMNGSFINCPEGCWTNEQCYPATEEQRKLLFEKMAEAGYERDDEKKVLNKIKMQDLVTSETNVTKISDQDRWNEEDIRMLNTVINIFEKVYPSNYFTTFVTGSENPTLINSPEIVKWLKGIKQKALGKLKLTKEDLEALRIAIINLGDMAEVDAINNFNMTFGEAKEKLIEIKDRYAE